MKKKIFEYLNEKGVKHSLSGFDYLMRAIEIGLEDKKSITNNICKNCYGVIAKENEVKSSQIERAMRHAIEKSDFPNLCVSEYIALAVDTIKYGDEEKN